jgi:integrase
MGCLPVLFPASSNPLALTQVWRHTQHVMTNNALKDQASEYLATRERLVRKGELSPATVVMYRDALSVFTTWAVGVGVHGPKDVTADVMESFEDYLREKPTRSGKPLAKETIRTYIRVARLFLSRSGSESTISEYKPPSKPGRRLFEVLTRQEIDALEQAATDERDRLVIRVLADTGLRAGELLGLRAEDLRENAHDRRYWLRVIGKGDAQRDVPIPPPVFKRLKHFAEHGGPKGAAYIFMGKRRRAGGEIERLTRSGVDQLVRGLALRADIGRRVWPHLLRHSYATWALSKNMNPLALQRILGHSSLAMISQTYSHLVISDTYDAMIEALR